MFFLWLVKSFYESDRFCRTLLLENNDKTFLMLFQMRDNHLGLVKKKFRLFSHCFWSVGGGSKHSINNTWGKHSMINVFFAVSPCFEIFRDLLSAHVMRLFLDWKWLRASRRTFTRPSNENLWPAAFYSSCKCFEIKAYYWLETKKLINPDCFLFSYLRRSFISRKFIRSWKHLLATSKTWICVLIYIEILYGIEWLNIDERTSDKAQSNRNLVLLSNSIFNRALSCRKSYSVSF